MRILLAFVGSAASTSSKSRFDACQNGAFGACDNQVLPVVETCNLLDDNCDGQVDEGCAPTVITRSCGSDVGLCSAGTQTCSLIDGVPTNCSACMGAVPPATETCNNLDDDCDGDTEEGGVCDAPLCTDVDGDGFYAQAACGTPVDCNDTNLAVHPGALETGGNGIR